MSSDLRVMTTPGGDGVPVLAVEGEIDMANVSTLRDALEDCLAEADRVTVDLTAVGYLDSAGLALFFAHAGRLDVLAPRLLSSSLVVSGLVAVADVTILPE